MTRLTIAFLAALASLGVATNASAQGDWPNKPVQMIVPFGAGGSGDTLARIVALYMSKSLGQQFVVENRPGAGGIIGTQQFIQAAPDGYTIGMTNLSSISLVPVINSHAGFDGDKDFTHIAYIGGSPVVLAAYPQTGVKTLKQFIDYSNTPGKSFAFATSGVGSDGHLMGFAIALATGVKPEHIPYKATAQALNDIVAGHVPFSTFTLSSTSPFLRAGAVNGIAVTSAERLPDFPDLPTFKELGKPELVGTTWFSLSGPKGLPKAIVDKINAEVQAAVATPEIQARFRRDGFLADPMSPAEFTKFVAAENAKWKKLVQKAGLEGAEH